jgi:hypothetical protein
MAHAGGRPTLLTAETLKDVERYLPTVMYMETVGDYLGVSRQTWRGWLRRGRKEHDRLKKARTKTEPLESEALYLQFFATVKKALAEGEIHDAAVIKKAATEQWQAAAWRLERRFPARWGRRDTTHVILDRLIEAQLAEAERAGQGAPAGTPQGRERGAAANGAAGRLPAGPGHDPVAGGTDP